MEVPADLRQLCVALNDFGLPRAIGHVTEGRLLLWNDALVQHANLSQAEFLEAQVELSERLAHGTEHDSETGLIPFALNIPSAGRTFLGHTVKRADGFLLMMLDITPGDVLLWHFWQGIIAGQEKEKRRMAQVIHDSFSPHLLAAFFLMNGIQERLEKVRPEEANRLAKATQLLNESIQNLASGVAEMPPEPVSSAVTAADANRSEKP